METDKEESFDMETLESTPDIDFATPLRSLYAALTAGDFTASAATMSAETILHVPGTSPNAGDYVGPEAVLGFVGNASAQTGGTLRLELDRAFADPEWGVALVTYTATRPDGMKLENHVAHVARLSGGLIVESWLQARDQYAVDKFWTA
jgi:ketosteroid isomerase-like protein